MSDYNYETIKSSILKWYEVIQHRLSSKEEIIISKNCNEAMVIDFEFQNCMAQLSVTNSPFEPYQYVYFEAVDIETSNSIYYFYDNKTMQIYDVLGMLDKAVIFCSQYQAT